MKIFVLFLVALVSASHRDYTIYEEDNAEELFERFIENHSKRYADKAEKEKRYEIFKNNLVAINKMNLESKDAVFGITMFFDLTTDEFINTYTGFDANITGSDCVAQSVRKGTRATDSFDWRDKNVVSRVKDQGSCGSCWAFSSTGTVESQYAIKNGQLIELSEQQLLDCDTTSNGCGGGTPESAIMYWAQNGAETEQDYSYEETQGQCRFDTSKANVKVTGCNAFTPGTEEELQNVLQDNGPLAIAVDATNLKGYQNGVFTACDFTAPNHAVLLVGYGNDNGTPYWTIKNSWGEGFGEQGYVKVQRGVNCIGIMSREVVTAFI